MFQPRQRRFTSRSDAPSGSLIRPADAAGTLAVAKQPVTFRRRIPVPPMQVERDGSGPNGFKDQSARYDAIVLRLLCAWIFLQCFYYNAIPWLRWNMGVIVTPDRLVLGAVLLIVACRPRSSRHSVASITRAGTAVGRAAALFTIIALTSWFVHDSDAGNARFGVLTWVVNLAVCPALTFFIATRLRYTRTMLKELLTFFALLGVYLSATAVAEHFNVTALVFPRYILDPTIGMHFGRSRGPFVDAISNGGMLLLSFLALTFFSASATGLKRFAISLLALLAVTGLYFTETRAVWLGVATVTVTLLILHAPLRRAATATTCVLVLAFLLGVGSKFSISQDTLFSRRQQSIDYRLDNYQIAGTHSRRIDIRPRVWQTWARWHNSSTGTRASRRTRQGNHSTVLGLLAELGLVGTIPYIGMVAGAAFVCFRSYRALDGPQVAFERQFAVIAIGALEVLVVLGLTNDLKAMPTVNIDAFLFVGVLTSVESTWQRANPARANGREAVLPPGRRSFRTSRPKSVR